jgi:hypothetical protein
MELIVSFYLAITFEQIGKHLEAAVEYLKAQAASGMDPGILAQLREAHRAFGLNGFRRKRLELELARWKDWHLDTFHMAAHFAQLGELDEALVWLEKSLRRSLRRDGLDDVVPVFQKSLH